MKAPPKPATPEAAKFTGFTSTGSYADRLSAVHRNTTAFVADMISQRKRIPPAELALAIRRSPFAVAFPNAQAGRWDQLGDFSYWQHVPTSSSAEEAVKRCGKPVENHCWQAGVWIVKPAGHDDSTSDRSDDIAALLAKAAQPYQPLLQDEWDRRRGEQLEAVRRAQGEASDPS